MTDKWSTEKTSGTGKNDGGQSRTEKRAGSKSR
jgi:hypothetical protein